MSKLQKSKLKAGQRDRVMQRKYHHQMIRCPDCKALVGPNAQTCWRCGKTLKKQ